MERAAALRDTCDTLQGRNLGHDGDIIKVNHSMGKQSEQVEPR
jgi:hypothetical protein